MCRKSWFIFASVVVVLIGVCIRLFYIVRFKPADVASSQNQWTVSVASTRGTIYDRDITPLVNDTKEYRAAVAPLESALTHLYSATTQQRFDALRNQLTSGVPAMVRLLKPVGLIDGIRLFQVPVRYSERLLAPHIIGYLDADGINGVSGIEASYNDLLNGFSGQASASFQVDGQGDLLIGVEPTSTNTTSHSKGGIVLTLDKEIQQITEDIAAQYLNKGAVIVLDSHNGNIRSLASYPTFQPNTVAQSIESNDGALLDRALSLYDCGSVFKIITTAAALEHGVSPLQEYHCDGFVEVEGVRFHCHNRLGHGTLSMTDAFAHSCNAYYIQLALEIGADTVWTTVQRFGLDDTISLAESLIAPKAMLPSIDTLSASKAALANFSFGQGYLMTTPLHFAQIVNTIVNDGVMLTPSIVRGTVDESLELTEIEKGRGERIISPYTADCLQTMMAYAVSYGTGVSAQPNNCHASGKTGTAETGQIIDGNTVTQSWFVGYFPSNAPEYVICVLAENSDQHQVKATDVFRELADAIYTMQ